MGYKLSVTSWIFFMLFLGTLAGCGAGGGGGDDKAPSGAQKGAVLKTIEVKETEFKLQPADITLDKPGTYVFRAVNSGDTVHALEVEGEGIEEGEVLDLLSGLVEKSLVMIRGGNPGGARYRLLEPVRQYALDKLEESDEAEEARRRHAEFFLALAEQTVTEMRGPEQAAWLDRLEAEHDNLRGALSWALERGEAELALRLAAALEMFWAAQGYFDEGRRWLEATLAMGYRASVEARISRRGSQ